MKKILRVFFILNILGFCFMSGAYAEVFHLKNGDVVDGKILNEDEGSYDVFVNEMISVKFFHDQIISIDGIAMEDVETAVVESERENASLESTKTKFALPKNLIMDPVSYAYWELQNPQNWFMTVAILFAIHFFCSYPIYFAAKVLHVFRPYKALIPFLNILMLARCANVSIIFTIFAIPPYVRPIFFTILWMRVFKRMNLNPQIGLLGIVPIVQLVFPWYFLVLQKNEIDIFTDEGLFKDME